ncbi:hypothetical protein FYK55_14225 [Roseiconus nitratireducens]|uniref:Uncharacterized protein n=1 Tax=Roseiconus nitratireducens TaxID=2605748 RepID=A0A5M6DC11_9BACT|nr:hypothetical protein [Roseiconus nitratireducens]KAA5542685.1 hypothetical protein FYK55_14225 [Roseiconus nitratireducens]
MKLILKYGGCSAVSALVGLTCAMIVGRLWWPPGAALTLIGIGLVTAACFARLLTFRFNWPASIIASAIGAMIACFFAGATAEVLPPGSTEWMVKGGLYGACFGLPVAILLAPLGLIEDRRRDRDAMS